MKKTRRDFIKLSSLAGIGFAGSAITPSYGSGSISPQSPVPVSANGDQLYPLNRMPGMVQEYFVEQVRKAKKRDEDRFYALSSGKDAEAYLQDIRARIQQCFGPWPEKTPLNPRITGIIKRGEYNIEKIIFESLPGYPVTANLYIPRKRKKPMPGVIGTCGHSVNGKASQPYQSFAQGLARKGYITLLFDPPGQGERLQYITSDLKPRHGIGVLEHLYAGNQMVLSDDYLCRWFAWDGIRALDYLLTRREVDPNHLGVTGNSGGGTQTTWLCGVEPRFTMAAPSCFVTSFCNNMENELPADSEQYPPHAIALGLDHFHFIAAMAPKPVILLGQEKDYFDARGLEESFSRLKHLYELLGVPHNIQLFIGPDYHGYSQLNREAMYGWFNGVTKISDSDAEPQLVIEDDATLQCTPNGQAGESNPRTIFSFTSLKAAELLNKRAKLNGEDLKKVVSEVLKLPEWKGVPYFRILRPKPDRLYPKKYSTSYIVETEPRIKIIVYRLDDNILLSRPLRVSKRALLYISHMSADDELRNDSFIRDLIASETNSTVFACDVRGIGESLPNTGNDDFLAPYGNDYFYAGYSIMLDYPYTGQKTYDILKIINWMKSFGHTEIHLAARGWGAIPATFAALLSDEVKQITLKNGLTSYKNIAENEDYNWPLASLLPGVLKVFDMPDCYSSLEAKQLRMIESWDQNAGKEIK